MWGTDLTSTMTGEGQASIFVTMDHASTESLDIHAARRATRFEALEPLRQRPLVLRCLRPGIAGGLSLATTMAACSSPTLPAGLGFIVTASNLPLRREPACYGSVERFIRTLKENLLWVHRFNTIEDLRLALHRFEDALTGPGSSSATATRLQRPSERRSSRRSRRRHEPATRCLTTVDRSPVRSSTASPITSTSSR